MNDKLFYRLLYGFPHLFPEGEESQIYVPDGWSDLVYNLCQTITQHQWERNYYPLHVTCIKEKFGHLRFYIEGSADVTIHTLIAEAENRSGEICEQSGNPGSLHEKNGWLKTLSEEKALELGYQKVQTLETFGNMELPWILPKVSLKC